MIDTLKLTQALEKAGLPRPQAEGMAEALRDSELVTKEDLESALNRFLVKVLLDIFALLIGTQAVFTSILIQAFIRHLKP
jgi:hypothetical protein